MNKFVFLLMACLFLVSSQALAFPLLSETKPQIESTSTSWILACGVSNFKDTRLDAPHYPLHSASELSSALQEVVGSQKCCTLENELATRSEILAKLKDGWLIGNARPEDRVYILLSLPCFPSDRKKEVFLLPYDADPNNLDKSAISLEQILNCINCLKCKNIVLFIQAPFAGAIEALGADDCWFGTYNMIVDNKLADKMEKKKNLVLILSSKENQPTTSGAFFNCFAKTLKNLPNSVSLLNLFERAKNKTMDMTKANCQVCKGQIPVLYGKWRAKGIILGPSCLIPSSSK